MLSKKILAGASVVSLAVLVSCMPDKEDSPATSQLNNGDVFGYCYYGGDVKNRDYWMQEYERCHQFRAEQAMTCCNLNYGAWIADDEPAVQSDVAPHEEEAGAEEEPSETGTGED